MASSGCISAILSILLCIHIAYVSGGRYLLEEDYVYRVRNSTGDVCLTASFMANFDLYYENVTYNGSLTIVNVTHQTIFMPNKTAVNVSGSCDNVTRTLVLTWLQNETTFTAYFEFMIASNNIQWFLSMAALEFDLDDNNFENPYDTGLKVYQTSSAANKYFNRTFGMHDYYYCQSNTQVWFSNTSSNSCFVVHVNEKNRTVCSFMTFSDSVIYVGDLDNTTTVNRKLCIGDYIKLQELIVPIVVGGILAILLVVIFMAYVIAYFRRRRKEGHYETLSNGY